MVQEIGRAMILHRWSENVQEVSGNSLNDPIWSGNVQERSGNGQERSGNIEEMILKGVFFNDPTQKVPSASR